MRKLVLSLVLLMLLTTLSPADEPAVLHGHKGWIGALAFAPDGRTLAAGTSAGNIDIWDLTRKVKAHSLPGHDDAVAALAFSADGTLLVSGGHDRLARLHRFDRDGKPAGQPLVLRGHAGAVLCVALPADAKRLFTGSIDGTIREWDTETGAAGVVLRQHTSWVNGLALDADGKTLASAGSDNALKLRLLLRPGDVQTVQTKEGEIRSIALSKNGRWLAAGIRYGWVRVWDREKKEPVFSVKAHAGETWALAFTPDGETLASAGGDWNQPGEVRLWDVATWKERTVLKHAGEVLCLAISQDGNWLAAGSWDRTVRVWRIAQAAK